MPTITVTVKDKWLPEGKKRWVIKGDDDAMYGAMPPIADRINKGETYDLVYKIDNWAGKSYNVVEGVLPPSGQRPAVTTAQGTDYSRVSGDPVKTEDISVLSLVKSIRLPLGDASVITHALITAAIGWRGYKEWQKANPSNKPLEPDRPEPDRQRIARPSLKDDLNDEIPY